MPKSAYFKGCFCHSEFFLDDLTSKNIVLPDDDSEVGIILLKDGSVYYTSKNIIIECFHSIHVTFSHIGLLIRNKRSYLHKIAIPRGLVWNTKMAAVTSCESYTLFF